jgi:hypothetical protein
MNNAPSLNLDDVDVDTVQIETADGRVSLESLLGGHAMAEQAASCEVCSCCAACCCCC